MNSASPVDRAFSDGPSLCAQQTNINGTIDTMLSALRSVASRKCTTTCGTRWYGSSIGHNTGNTVGRTIATGNATRPVKNRPVPKRILLKHEWDNLQRTRPQPLWKQQDFSNVPVTAPPPSAFNHRERTEPVHALCLDPKQFNSVLRAARTFFGDVCGFTEVHTQNRLSILAACEDPKNVARYEYMKQWWPLPQTGQMWLEYELLTKPDTKGFYCVSTSYRSEPDAVAGRHFSIFPMIEFETHGDEADLKRMFRDFCAHMGLEDQHIGEDEFESVAARWGGEDDDVDHAAEEALYTEEKCPALLLTRFPERANPFWNMARTEDGKYAKKIDTIMGGQETIGSAERSVDLDQMYSSFYTVENGEYAQLLFKLFGRDRVEQELNDFLCLPMFPRFGGGIVVTRLMQAMERYSADGYTRKQH